MSLTYLEGRIAAIPAFSSILIQCGEYYRKKLWHQLTLEIERLISDKECPLNFLLFEENFISDFAKYMNVLSYASIIVKICRRYSWENGRSFCDRALKWINTHYNSKQNAEELKFEQNGTQKRTTMNVKCAQLLLQCQIAYFALEEDAENKGFEACKSQLFAIENEMNDSIFVWPPILFAHFHFVHSKLFAHGKNRNFRLFYTHAMHFLEYCSMDDIYGGTVEEWAAEICIAALMDPNFFNFGQLSLHPILQSLNGTPHESILNIVHSFIVADIEQCMQAIAEYDSESMPELVDSQVLNVKIELLCLVRLAFDKPSTARVISFENIGCKHHSSVENLVMRAMSLKLIAGIIDGIDGTLNVTWICPRILDMQEIKNIANRMSSWMNTISNVDLTQAQVNQELC